MYRVYLYIMCTGTTCYITIINVLFYSSACLSNANKTNINNKSRRLKKKKLLQISEMKCISNNNKE